MSWAGNDPSIASREIRGRAGARRMVRLEREPTGAAAAMGAGGRAEELVNCRSEVVGPRRARRIETLMVAPAGRRRSIRRLPTRESLTVAAHWSIDWFPGQKAISKPWIFRLFGLLRRENG